MGRKKGEQPKNRQKVQKGKGKATAEGDEDNPPNAPSPNAPSHQQQRPPAQNQQVSTVDTAKELEALNQRVEQLTEECTASKEVATSLENTNKLLEAKIAELQSEQATRPTTHSRKKKRVPRPKGSKWRLRDKMGLANDEVKYNQIIRKLRNIKNEAGFKDGSLFNDQSKDKIVKYCKVARKEVAYLRRFKGDWATTAYLRRSFCNRRGYLNRSDDKDPKTVDKNRSGPSGTNHDEDEDDDVDIGGDDDLRRENDQDDFANPSEDDDGESD
ncbi:hypothetical protein BDM02DRAFT_3185493 [Thelephora ganbajun]|uniref:Uncharacterized protein n=1 Tax=Thelephora ganbajun TaxID=370292 RepID=A0ACB6ZL70_THEGA|nr:hypothetical protein BDM02DRAFT_3185493 [Thelephora ganbajun]